MKEMRVNQQKIQTQAERGPQNMIPILSSLKVNDLIATRPFKATQPITCQTSEPLSSVMARMTKARIHCVPVVQDHKVVALLDVLDVTCYLNKHFSSPNSLQAVAEPRKLLDIKCEDVCNFSKKNPVISVSRNTNALEASRYLAEGIQRLVVTDGGIFENLCSQSDMLRCLDSIIKLRGNKDLNQFLLLPISRVFQCSDPNVLQYRVLSTDSLGFAVETMALRGHRCICITIVVFIIVYLLLFICFL